MKSLLLFLIERKKLFKENCLKNPEKAKQNIKNEEDLQMGDKWIKNNFKKCLFSLIVNLFLLFSLVNCTSSPVISEEVVQRFRTPEEIVPQWQFFHNGMDYIAIKLQNPRLELWAVRIDLTESSFGVVVSENDPVNGVVREGFMPSTWVSSFAKRYNTLVAINTNPFDPVSGREGEERLIIGTAISEGRLVSPAYSSFDALVFYEDRSMAIVKQSELENLEGIEYATGGFYRVLQDGVLVNRLRSDDNAVRHPRSAAGISKDGKTLYLLAIDGRRLGSIGATEAEIAIILEKLGAYNGLNFDGGGSTSFVLRRPDGKIQIVNKPIHGGIPGRERGVATCLGIVLR